MPNPSFEFYTYCPTSGLAQIESAEPWVDGSEGTADYFHVCASPGVAGVPINQLGNQWPFTGQAYAGGMMRHVPSGPRDYIQAPLELTLEEGSAYLVTFYVSLAEDKCQIRPFGALFTVEPPVSGGTYYLPYSPQVEVFGEYLDDTENWMQISRCFIAEGGEAYITIGNFRNNDEIPPPPECGGGSNPGYYYIDEVSVIAMPLSESYFVMDPVTACGSYTIDPGQAQNYTWGDGTTFPTHTVTQSGTYYVTLSDECAFQYGEIDVTIIPDAPPVELPGDTVLCAGEVLLISLDPGAGTYQWQDGSGSANYTISTEGMYIVSLDDDCDVTRDTIFVLYLDAPEPFSLGADTVICPGDVIVLSFDPSLGSYQWQDGSSSSQYVISAPGTYTLTISNMCGQEQSSVTVDWVEEIEFAFDESLVTFCEGEHYVITLDPELGDFLWSDGSTGNSITIENSGIVSVTISNICFSVSDYIEAAVIRPPEFSLGPDVSLCAGELPFVLNLSNVQHAQFYAWSTGNTTSIQSIDSAGTYSVTVSNSCFSFSDAIVVTVTDGMPQIALAGDDVLCPGASLVLYTSGATGNYLWQDSTTSDTLLVTIPGVYAVTVTTSCGAASDSVIIDMIPPLDPPDLGMDFSLCPGESAVLYANISGVAYQWQDASTADSIIVTGPGTYWLEISDACSAARDTIHIAFGTDPPQVSLPETLQLCIGDTIEIAAGVSGVQYQWSDGSMLSTLAVHAPGLYHITVSNACGMDADTVMVTDGGPAPSVSLGDDLSLCAGESIAVQPEFIAVDNWQWHDGSTTDSIIVSTAGVIYIDVWNDCGMSSDTLHVQLLPDIPSLDLGDDLALCPGETAEIVIDIPDVEVLWSNGSNDPALIVSAAGMVYATITNACGSSSDTLTIILYDPPPMLDLGNDQSLCPGETIVIAPGLSGVAYLWHDGSTGAVFETTLPGLVILTITNICGTATDSLAIIENTDGPQIDLGEDVLACIGDTIILHAGISGVSYLWQDGSTGASYSVTQSGEYYLQVSNACGTDSDTVMIDISGIAPAPDLGADTTLCDGAILILQSHAGDDTQIMWQDGATSSQYVVAQAGVYILTEINHCGTASDTMIVDVEQSPPVFDLGGDVVLCPGDTLVLHAPPTDALITWQDGSTSEIYYATQPQTYSLTLSNHCGTTTDALTLSFDEHIPEIAIDPQSLCDEESTILDATQPFPAAYLWSTGSTSSIIQVNTPAQYAVTVSTDCHTAHEQILVTHSTDCADAFYIPNIFSPNGDGINDTWSIAFNPAMPITAVQCRIFDRWGNLLYEALSLPVAWDGRFRGALMQPGVYVYTLHLTTLRNGEERTRVMSGDVTLAR